MQETNGRATTRVGIVGLGNIGRYHADHLQRLGEREPVALVGGMDIDPDAREGFRDEYDVAAYDDVGDLYDGVDAVIVTTPNRFHEEYTIGALEAGIDVLVEKPLAHTVESAERIAAAANDAGNATDAGNAAHAGDAADPGIAADPADAADAADGADAADAADPGDGGPICMVGFHNRFAAPVQVLRAHVEAGRFGDVYHVEANYVRRRGVPGRGSWFTDRATAGGGALIDIGAHAIDLALYVMGYPDVVEVAGVTRDGFGSRDDYTYLDQWGETGDGGFDVDDSASAFVRCAGGRTISLETSWAANRPPDNGFVVQGTEAGATFDRDSGELTIHEISSVGGAHFSDAAVETQGDQAHLAEQARFLEAVRTGTEPPVSVEEALTVQRVIDAIYRSSETERAVRLTDEDAPLTTNTGD